MFTVILLSRANSERFSHWQELFDPFQDEGEIAICEWNHKPHIHDLNEAVPALAETIKGKKEWRLLAVGTGTEGLSGEYSVDPENPFDYILNWGGEGQEDEVEPGLSLQESQFPLVRLSHMLFGYPEMGTNTFFPDLSYWDRESRQRVYESQYIAERELEGIESDRAKEEFLALLPSKHDVQTHYHQNNFSQEDERKYLNLIKRYEVRQSAPTEVVFLALREPKPHRPTDDLRSAWKQGEKSRQTQFVARNDYHPTCRFVVFDLQTEDHSSYHLGEMKFWLSALSIAINDLPASSFQSERLYNINVEIDSLVFSHMLNQHMGRLTSARERLDNEIRKPRTATRMEIDEILRKRPVAVSFENLSGDDLRVTTSGFGFASDRPSREMNRWEQSYSELNSAAEDFKRKPRRVLAKAVEGARESVQTVELPDEPMSKIERDELEEELNQRIRRLTEATTREILDKQKLEDLLVKSNKEIRHAIRERMTASTILWSSAIITVIWTAVFIPFVVAALGSGGVALTESLIVAAGVAGALAGTAILTLVLMRRALVKKLSTLNSSLRKYVSGVKNKASAFGDFLTDVRTYMYGRSYLDADSKRHHLDRRRNKDYLKDLHRIRDVIEREKSLVRSVGEQVAIKRVSNFTLDLSTWDSAKLRGLLSLDPSAQECSFNYSGDSVKAAYDFIERLKLVDLHLTEDRVRQRRILMDLSLNRESEDIIQ